MSMNRGSSATAAPRGAVTNLACVSIAYRDNSVVQRKTSACVIQAMFAMQLACVSRKMNVMLHHAQLGSIGTIVAMSARSNTVLVMIMHVRKYVKLVVSAMKAVIVMQVASVSNVVERKRAETTHTGTTVEAHARQSVANQMLNFVPSNVWRNVIVMTASFSMPRETVSHAKTVPPTNARTVSTGTLAGAVARRKSAAKVMTCAQRSAKSDVNVTMVWSAMRVRDRVFLHRSAVLNNVVIMKSGMSV